MTIGKLRTLLPALAAALGAAACDGSSGSDLNNRNNAAGSQNSAGSSASSSGGDESGTTGSGGTSATAGAGASGDATGGDASTAEKFSFFVTSLKAMRSLSGSDDGFGGDLRFGETGVGAGLRGADKICTTIAEISLPENGKTWHAFLSATAGEDGMPVNAIDRIGEGPWYDRTGRLVAQAKADLLAERPTGADDAIVSDLPNEDGVPNHAPEGGQDVDNHDVMTGTNAQGQVYSPDASFTCLDWTSAVGAAGKPRCGHSWPRLGMMMPPKGDVDPNNWMSALTEAGCAPGAFVVEAGGPGGNKTLSVGDGGGYGAIYCFATTP